MLTAEILIYKQQTAQNIIEIGKRLIEVKEALGHGEWESWLKEKVDFSSVTAWRFMKAAQSFGNLSTLKDFSQSKIFALLDLPAECREEFIKQNPVNQMTTRELQQAIKLQKEAEHRAQDAEQKLAKELEESKKLEEAVSIIEEDNATLRRENKKLANKPVETVVPADYEQLKAANQILENKLKTAGDPIIVETPVQVFPPDYERIKKENEQFKIRQSSLSVEQIQKVNNNCHAYKIKIDNEAEVAGKIHEALSAPQIAPMKILEQALTLYLEYFPGGINDALTDCDRSIANLVTIKQGFVNMSKLKVVKN